MALKKLTKGTKIGEIIRVNPDAAKIFSEEGLHCALCPMSAEETLEEGCASHGIKINNILKKLNKKVNKP